MNDNYMMYDWNENTIGYFQELRLANDESDRQHLSLYGFRKNPDYIPHQALDRIYVGILNIHGMMIGQYDFPLKSVIHTAESIPFSYDGDWELLVHTYEQVARTRRMFEMWDLLRDPSSLRCGLWIDLTLAERKIWQTVARTYALQTHSWRNQGQAGMTIHLDGRLITDQYAFFFMLGEQLNGPVGYYGSSLDAMEDCLCGDFGSVPPFTVIWSHYQYMENNELLQRKNDHGHTMLEVIQTAIAILEEHAVTIIKE
ncbi:barstar family protein [Paenibacillus wenxiniae]|uniref:Barstar family protein n=1 Tax=Paenibacillus wenxiniae TaxID=1636843 RepID=A0ABW4RF91_9BACL